MTLEALNQRLTQPGVDLDQVLGQKQDGGIKLTEPLNPPSGWTQFKAALSSIPLLGQLGSLQEARAECESYPVRLQQYQTENRQILAGLVSDMRAKYGDNIANMAVRDLHHTDGAPLTGRTVSTMLQQAEKTQASYRSWNNQVVTRFLENGLTGGRARGETDMMGICLERGMKLGGEDQTWQGMVSPQAGRFIEHQVMQNCKALPEYSQGHLSNEQIAKAAEDALDLYQELLSAPGMTPSKLDAQLDRIDDSKYREGGQAVANTMREFVIMESTTAPMDRRNPDSMLCRVAKAATDKLGLAPLPDGVLKSISNNMLEGLRYRTGNLHNELGCEKDVTSIIHALGPKLEAQVQRAVDEHIEALRMIKDSTTLTPAAKETLLEIAQTRRIDPEQVRVYEDVARSMSKIGDSLRQSNPGACIENILKSLTAFEEGLQSMKMHGREMWESTSLDGGEFTNKFMDEIAKVMAESYTPEQARELLATLTSPEGTQVVSSLRMSEDMRMMAQCPILYLVMVEAVAVQAGHTAEEARNIMRGISTDSDTPLTLDKLPPTVARIIVGSPPESIDDRGVVQGSRNGKLVSRDFNPGQVIGTYGQEISDWILRDPPSGSQPWLSKTMETDVGRATYYMDGECIGVTGEKSGTTLEKFRAPFPEGPDGDALALGVSRCMNQIGINTFFEINNQSAFPGKVGSFTGGKTTHEAWPNDDGSWSVRSTHTSRPNAFASPEGVGEPEQVKSDGTAMYTLTYRIDPPGRPGDQPTISITDSQVVFDF